MFTRLALNSGGPSTGIGTEEVGQILALPSIHPTSPIPMILVLCIHWIVVANAAIAREIATFKKTSFSDCLDARYLGKI